MTGKKITAEKVVGMRASLLDTTGEIRMIADKTCKQLMENVNTIMHAFTSFCEAHLTESTRIPLVSDDYEIDETVYVLNERYGGMCAEGIDSVLVVMEDGKVKDIVFEDYNGGQASYEYYGAYDTLMIMENCAVMLESMLDTIE